MTVTRETWRAKTIERLRRAMPARAVELIADDPAITLLHYDNPDLLIAVRSEHGHCGPELCIVGVEGQGTATHWPAFLALVREQGFRRLRCHTSIDSPARRRLWAGLGFEPAEVISYYEV